MKCASNRRAARRAWTLRVASNRRAARRVSSLMDLALFDFDGTITHSDSFRPFLYFASGRRRRLLGTLLLGPLVLLYELGLFPTPRMRQAAAYACFCGRDATAVRELGAAYADTLASAVRPEALERIAWHQRRGDAIVVVSASLDVYLQAWCQRLGIECVCTELETRGGRLSGRYAGGDCSGAEKARRVRARYDLSRYEHVYAYGDTAEDEALLALASRPYFCWKARYVESEAHDEIG